MTSARDAPRQFALRAVQLRASGAARDLDQRFPPLVEQDEAALGARQLDRGVDQDREHGARLEARVQRAVDRQQAFELGLVPRATGGVSRRARRSRAGRFAALGRGRPGLHERACPRVRRQPLAIGVGGGGEPGLERLARGAREDRGVGLGVGQAGGLGLGGEGAPDEIAALVRGEQGRRRRGVVARRRGAVAAPRELALGGEQARAGHALLPARRFRRLPRAAQRELHPLVVAALEAHLGQRQQALELEPVGAAPAREEAAFLEGLAGRLAVAAGGERPPAQQGAQRLLRERGVTPGREPRLDLRHVAARRRDRCQRGPGPGGRPFDAAALRLGVGLERQRQRGAQLAALEQQEGLARGQGRGLVRLPEPAPARRGGAQRLLGLAPPAQARQQPSAERGGLRLVVQAVRRAGLGQQQA